MRARAQRYRPVIDRLLTFGERLTLESDQQTDGAEVDEGPIQAAQRRPPRLSITQLIHGASERYTRHVVSLEP